MQSTSCNRCRNCMEAGCTRFARFAGPDARVSARLKSIGFGVRCSGTRKRFAEFGESLPAFGGATGEQGLTASATPQTGWFRHPLLAAVLVAIGGWLAPLAGAESKLLLLENGSVKIGIDPAKGGSITWLSWRGQDRNVVNHADPGRLIQQSYYAGHRLDRRAEGQSKAWSPWTWNPIQGGGVASWARVTELRRLEDGSLYAETVPRLWDMPGEEAAALMRQWTAIEPGMENVVVVRCEITCQREPGDRWGPAAMRPQEVPACYFTRIFSDVRSYLGGGEWRAETQPPGPPWGKAQPPRKAMACFSPNGQGVAVFSPVSTQPWNFGPHAGGASADSAAGPCMHIAPIDRAPLGLKSIYRYRYWLVVGDAASIGARLDALWAKYQGERAELRDGS